MEVNNIFGFGTKNPTEATDNSKQLFFIWYLYFNVWCFFYIFSAFELKNCVSGDQCPKASFCSDDGRQTKDERADLF